MRSYPESFDSSLLVTLLDRLDVNSPQSRQLASIELSFIMHCMDIYPELSVMAFEVHSCFSWTTLLTYIQNEGFQVLLQKLLGDWDDLSLIVCKFVSAVVHGCRQRLSVSNQSLMRACSDHLVKKLVAGMSVFLWLRVNIRSRQACIDDLSKPIPSRRRAILDLVMCLYLRHFMSTNFIL